MEDKNWSGSKALDIYLGLLLGGCAVFAWKAYQDLRQRVAMGEINIDSLGRVVIDQNSPLARCVHVQEAVSILNERIDGIIEGRLPITPKKAEG